MIAEIIIIWVASIYFSMYFAGQKDLSIRKAFVYSLFFSVFAFIFYSLWVRKDGYTKHRYHWGGLGFMMLWFFGAIALFWMARFYFTRPPIF